MQRKSKDQIQRDWHYAVALGHKADLAKARVGAAILANAGGDLVDARRLARTYLGVAQNTGNLVVRMAKALEEVGDPDVWTAIGWKGVRSLTKLPTAERSKIAEKAIAEYRKTGERLSGARVKALTGARPTPPKPRPKPSARPTPPETEKPKSQETATDPRLVEMAQGLRRLMLLEVVREFMDDRLRELVDELAPAKKRAKAS